MAPVLLAWLMSGLSAEWTVETPGELLIEGQTSRGVHGPTGAGIVFRELTELPTPGGRKLKHVDVEAALSGVTLARAVEAENEGAGQTVAVGRGQISGVGRWVYVAEDRLWWQVFWEEGGVFQQAMAFSSIEQAGPFAAAMTALERELPSSEALLFDANRADCAVTLKVDLNRAQAETRQLEDVRLALSGAGPLAGLRAGGLLDRHAERCVHAEARTARACRVVEGDPSGTQSLALQEAVTRCLDEDTELLSDIKTGIAPWL
jgi:hypothetical protein